MNFEEFNIDESDYEFYQSLPKDEKILFLFDLICDEVYGTGSMNDEDIEEIQISNSNTFDSFLGQFEDYLFSLVQKSIDETQNVNILLLNNSVVINSNSEKFLDETVNDLMLDGYILSEIQLSLRALSVFHQQRYCKAFIIVDKENEICLN
jgi:hypothetical protein